MAADSFQKGVVWKGVKGDSDFFFYFIFFPVGFLKAKIYIDRVYIIGDKTTRSNGHFWS